MSLSILNKNNLHLKNYILLKYVNLFSGTYFNVCEAWKNIYNFLSNEIYFNYFGIFIESTFLSDFLFNCKRFSSVCSLFVSIVKISIQLVLVFQFKFFSNVSILLSILIEQLQLSVQFVPQTKKFFNVFIKLLAHT